MAGVSAAWLALHFVFFPPSRLRLSFFQSFGSCTRISPVFSVQSERIQSFQALVLHETEQQKHKSSSSFLFSPSPNHRCKCLFGSSCAVLICGISANCCHVYHYSPLHLLSHLCLVPHPVSKCLAWNGLSDHGDVARSIYFSMLSFCCPCCLD